MVVKNSQAVTRAAAPRLPPLPKLRVRKPDQAGANPCIGVMSSVLGIPCHLLVIASPILTTIPGCWASSGYTTQGCAALEQQLRACMDAPVRPCQESIQSTSTNPPDRKQRRTRRAPSTTTFRDYTPKLLDLTSGNRWTITLPVSYYVRISSC